MTKKNKDEGKIFEAFKNDGEGKIFALGFAVIYVTVNYFYGNGSSQSYLLAPAVCLLLYLCLWQGKAIEALEEKLERYEWKHEEESRTLDLLEHRVEALEAWEHEEWKRKPLEEKEKGFEAWLARSKAKEGRS